MTATSLADSTIRTLSATSSVIDSPTFSQSLLGACSVASLEHMSLVSGVTVPDLQRLEGDIGRHQLGEGCRAPLGVGIFGVEHCAVIGLEDKGWTGGRA